jgi:hypothetical protein
MFGDLKLKWAIFKAEISIAIHDARNLNARMKYCRRGYHKLRNGMIQFGNINGTKTVRFLRCEHCRYVFFTSKYALKKYRDIEKTQKQSFRDMFAHMSKVRVSKDT